MNANSSSGFKIQESYERFEIEYNAFIDKFEQKGGLPSAAHVDSRSAQGSSMIVVHSNVDIHLFVIGTRLSATVVRKSCTTLSHFHPIIHRNAQTTMKTNFYLKNNVLTNSPRRNLEIHHVLHNIGQVKKEVEDVCGDHEWAIVI